MAHSADGSSASEEHKTVPQPQQKQTTSSAKSFISGGFGGISAVLVGKFSLPMTITKQPLTLISSLLFSLDDSHSLP